jgi:L-methionine (R)-S-oxide reductase
MRSPTHVSKDALYDELATQVNAVIEDLDDSIAVMATVCAILHAALPAASFVGFYRAVGAERLRIGPYQGPLACLEIAFGKGVCGTAAQNEVTQVVADVGAFPGHIACDPSARSEIVVPVFDAAGALAAVLDVDSRQRAAFDETDRVGLERVAGLMSPHLRT